MELPTVFVMPTLRAPFFLQYLISINIPIQYQVSTIITEVKYGKVVPVAVFRIRIRIWISTGILLVAWI
jgi:hypothetical protein